MTDDEHFKKYLMGTKSKRYTFQSDIYYMTYLNCLMLI